jgi:hypothetical protein
MEAATALALQSLKKFDNQNRQSRSRGFSRARPLTASLLLDMIEQERESSEVDDVTLRPTLIVRQSTTVPPRL